MLKPLFYLLFILAFTVTYSQGEEQNETSNIQNYTPSKLLENGKWDVKWFNNLYTQTKADVNSTKIDVLVPTFHHLIRSFTGVRE
jgi:hypothetical protein